MIGQSNLLKKLTSYTLSTLPHSMLFIGEKGCGKHSLINDLSKYYGIEINDITANLTFDTLTNIYTIPTAYFYVIDICQINEKQQNVVLKFLEEPSVNAYVVLLCENKNQLLSTISNRCISYEFETYTKDQLKNFVQDDENEEYILSICRTPGQVKSVSGKTLSLAVALSDAMIETLNFNKVDLSRALSILDMINFKDEYDKPGCQLVVETMSSKLLKIIKSEKNVDASHLYGILNKYANRLKDSRINAHCVFEKMIIEMWRMNRENA